MTRSFYVERDGLRLHATEEGDLNGPIVVLVHGYPDDSEVWDGVAGQLASEFRILRYDVRGAGLSDVPRKRADYRMKELVADLLAVVDAVEENASFHVVGHDWGSIQLWEAVTDPIASTRILSFVSASGPCLDHVALQMQASMRKGDVRERVRALKQAAKSWYIGAFQMPFLPELAWSKAASPTIEKRIAAAENIPHAAFCSAHRSKNGTHGVQLYRANIPERFRHPTQRTSEVPTYILIPQRDNYVSEYIAHSCEPWVSAVEFERTEGGHWFYLDQPKIFATAIHNHVKNNM